ncbi:peroxynitrite isomerase THAP4-like [Dicentrarchus labrax]|uniref:peroxynitrite isomerase THAP4-like n=1 Tax=Dicentrarchus labrax TaxID=13489 RepID=UPI0021F61F45|nr:peroxynitrite isomerase THAP4-like [Dicentrarchus labrax]
MPLICCAAGCNNKKGDPKISFYRLPQDEKRHHQWLAAIKRADWTPTANTRLCVAHFVSGVKSQNPPSPDFVPTIFPYLSSPNKRKRINQMTRFKETHKLKRKRVVSLDRGETGKEEEGVELDKDDRLEFDREDRHELDEEDGQEINRGDEEVLGREDGHELDEEDGQEIDRGDEEVLGREDGHELDGEEGQEIESEEPRLETSSDVGLALGRSCGNASCEATMKRLNEECTRLQTEIWKLKGQVNSLSFNQENLKDKDDKVHKLTGLPSYVELIVVFSFISSFLKLKSCLSPFQQFLLTLMRLRMNLPLFFLAHVCVSCIYVNCWSGFQQHIECHEYQAV